MANVSAALVGMQGMPGLVILYPGLVKKKWALNSAFMALYSFAAVMPCWVLRAYKMSFGHRLIPTLGKDWSCCLSGLLDSPGFAAINSLPGW